MPSHSQPARQFSEAKMPALLTFTEPFSPNSSRSRPATPETETTNRMRKTCLSEIRMRAPFLFVYLFIRQLLSRVNRVSGEGGATVPAAPARSDPPGSSGLAPEGLMARSPGPERRRSGGPGSGNEMFPSPRGAAADRQDAPKIRSADESIRHRNTQARCSRRGRVRGPRRLIGHSKRDRYSHLVLRSFLDRPQLRAFRRDQAPA